jgi:putative transposase
LHKKAARRARVPTVQASRPNEKWAMDFIAARLLDGRWFRVLTVIDQFTRECLACVADISLSGVRVVRELERLTVLRVINDN